MAPSSWSSLPNILAHSNVLPIIDLSSSMTSRANGTTDSCMTVAAGLGMYFSEHNTGAFKDIWFNFKDKPNVQRLKGNSLSERWNNMDKNDWSGTYNNKDLPVGTYFYILFLDNERKRSLKGFFVIER